ncbi:Plexin-A2-like protein [Leptotrombidium deliense]|uniref:Plexin-A2-like protein n=1 Tax=Leptotrombidium deliense TaxID=299467 RepID=A0A443SF52_9ACAR|nr:Plexin-A2-like protein [Leptotrombidium deliense]
MPRSLCLSDSWHTKYINSSTPIISHINANYEKGAPRIAKGIPAGGIIVKVNGYNLESNRTAPLIYVEVNGMKYTGTCEVNNKYSMKCKSPRVPLEKLDFSKSENEESSPLELDFGFIMDDYKSVMDLNKRKYNPFPKFFMFKNPELFKFSEPGHIKHINPNDYITIDGKNVDLAATKNDVTVKVGSGTCKMMSMSHNKIACIPPDAKSGDIRDVVVTVGDALNFTIGRLIYD